MGGANYIILLLEGNWCDQETTLWQIAIACLHVCISLVLVRDNQLISCSYPAHIDNPKMHFLYTQLVTY